MFAVDKHRAVTKQRRIPEYALWIVSVIGGAAGSFLGMRACRHKTKHMTFAIGMPVLMFVEIFIIYYFFG